LPALDIQYPGDYFDIMIEKSWLEQIHYGTSCPSFRIVGTINHPSYPGLN